MKKIAYLRVSTSEQRLDRQIDGLTEMSDELHIETLSAVSKRRPVYEHVMARLQPGDIFVVWDLDRAYRSTLEALNELKALHKRGINFTIANLRLDTTTPEGYWAFTVMSANAELERRTLSRRTKEGLEAARRRGARIGRPPILTEEQVRLARSLIETGGRSNASVAREMNVPRWTLGRALRRQAV